MLNRRRTGSIALAAVAALVAAAALADAQTTVQSGLPNPYTTDAAWAKLPGGRTWGSSSAVEVDKDGTTIWVGERCGVNTCRDSVHLDPILHFDANGNAIKSFGKGTIMFPHGLFTDRDGNIWLADGQGTFQLPASQAAVPAAPAAAGAAPAGGGGRGGAAAGAPGAAGAAGPGGRGGAAAAGPPPAPRGMQVTKFTPDGTVLMTIGKLGGDSLPGCCYQPNDILVAPDGSIFVTQGHGTPIDRIFKYSKDGKTLLTSWGERGSGPGQFSQPHSLAMDSRGRLFVADRANNRIQIFDQNGKLLDIWYQFSRISGIYIDKNDVLYAADSESSAGNHPGWQRGIRVGSAKDGSVWAFIPDSPAGTSDAEGVVVDAKGNIYGAIVDPGGFRRYAAPSKP